MTINIDKNKNVLTNITWMFFDKIFILLLNFVVTIRIANYYGTLKYGMYQYAISTVALFEIAMQFIDARVVKKSLLYNDPDDVVINVTVIRLLLAFISLIGAVFYIAFINEDINYKMIFLIVFINYFILDMRFGMQNRFEYLLMSKRIVIASNISLMIGAVLQLVAVSKKLSILSIALISALSAIINLFIVWIQYFKKFGRINKGKIKKELILQMMKESFPLAIGAACSVIYSRCDSVMIGNMLSKTEVGVYSISYSLIMVTLIAVNPIRESFYPRMVVLFEKDKNRYKRLYIQITSVLSWICILGIAFSFVVIPFVLTWFDKGYAQALPVYKIYVISVIFMYNAGLRAGHFTLMNRGEILMYSQLISVVLNIVLNVVLIKAFGTYGAALATCITQFISLYVVNLFWGDEGKKVLLWQIKGLNPINIVRLFRNID